MPKMRGQTGSLRLSGKGRWTGIFWQDFRKPDGKLVRAKKTVQLGFLCLMSREEARKKLSTMILEHEAREKEASLKIDMLSLSTRGELSGLTKHAKGKIGEMLTAIDLIKRGFQVFEHVSEFASCDLLALDPKTGNTLRVEVKFAGLGLGKPRVRLYALKSRFDVMAVVDCEGHVHYLDIHGGNACAKWKILADCVDENPTDNPEVSTTQQDRDELIA